MIISVMALYAWARPGGGLSSPGRAYAAPPAGSSRHTSLSPRNEHRLHWPRHRRTSRSRARRCHYQGRGHTYRTSMKGPRPAVSASRRDGAARPRCSVGRATGVRPLTPTSKIKRTILFCSQGAAPLASGCCTGRPMSVREPSWRWRWRCARCPAPFPPRTAFGRKMRWASAVPGTVFAPSGAGWSMWPGATASGASAVGLAGASVGRHPASWWARTTSVRSALTGVGLCLYPGLKRWLISAPAQASAGAASTDPSLRSGADDIDDLADGAFGRGGGDLAPA